MTGGSKRIKTALISVYNKERLEEIIKRLNDLQILMYSTGGTLDVIVKQGVQAESIELLTGYPSIFGGRVKTLHPKVFGGILARRTNVQDSWQLEQYGIPGFDLIIVDLYPFEETLTMGATPEEIIEKIDIGGIALIRAAAKNYNDVLIISSRNQYDDLIKLLDEKKGESELEERRRYATKAFCLTSHYDSCIFNYFKLGETTVDTFDQTASSAVSLRYGENPHQKGTFYGKLEDIFSQLHGKEISYNNLLDIDAALNLINDFAEPTYATLKHNNACGCASDENLAKAWKKTLAGDPISAFGGIIITNREVDEVCAGEINKLFFEIIIAPAYSDKALELLQSKKNRIILKIKNFYCFEKQFRSLLNGVLVQDKDIVTETIGNLNAVTNAKASDRELEDLIFANKLVKHSKSNAIVLVKNKQLLASGIGQTSRVDALKQAIEKAKSFGFDLQGAVMASEAYFPFPDCVEIAYRAGITAIVQPGGSIKDQESIDYCNANNIAMVFTGNRHFKH
ncbi:MAG: bifunctional phosphoribosylaminoimidazolecarboxamide formyltransferase/IMP cyclohydrolase [Prevotellaceae bacterium]|jgi:phosphoribosylaminoimidazolecarboxamide formyltransferase/IMP cyclohydrolase|nr:bifunctional phosphoribosylaminoimidazolecarboxamide formyltransferase/IMP cyclohydrolase [Prevotellaceae bacterium]